MSALERTAHDSYEARMPVAWVLDPELRPADLGILLRLVVLLPTRETLTLDDLTIGASGVEGTGRYAARAAVDNLIRLGYITRERVRVSGRLKGVEYRINY